MSWFAVTVRRRASLRWSRFRSSAKLNALKSPKDLRQGTALLDAVRQTMPHYALDEDFERSLPGDLAPFYVNWANAS